MSNSKDLDETMAPTPATPAAATVVLPPSQPAATPPPAVHAPHLDETIAPHLDETIAPRPTLPAGASTAIMTGPSVLDPHAVAGADDMTRMPSSFVSGGAVATAEPMPSVVVNPNEVGGASDETRVPAAWAAQAAQQQNVGEADGIIGRELAGYVVKKKLAEGGMGVVYLAEHAKIGRKSAIKVLKFEYCSNPEVVERFQQEARAVNEIRHENIVDIYDFGRDSFGRAFFVMELLEGESLADRLKRGPMTYKEAMPVLDQTMRALAAAHAKGFTHRDLKPDNIWLGKRDNGKTHTKLLDFGIAKLRGDDEGAGGVQEKLTKTGTVMGTPDYMSPEQINGADTIDRRADLYSMGCIIYELFTGHTPFVGNSMQAIMSGHLFKEPPRLVGLPENLGVPSGVADVVDLLLAKKPEDRYGSAAEVLADLRAVGGGTQPSITLQKRTAFMRSNAAATAAGAKARSEPVPVARSGRTWLVPALAIGLLGGGAAIYMATRDRSAPAPTSVAPVAAPPTTPAPPPKPETIDYLKVREDALALLRNSLQATEPQSRVFGSTAVGVAHDQASVVPLTSLAERDPDPEVRGHAAEALGVLDAIDALAMLNKAEQSAPPPLKVWYASAQARLGDKKALARLATYAGDKDLSVAFKAGLALGEISPPGDKAALAALSQLSTREAELNQIAPYAGAVILSQLARLRHAKARKILYGVLGATDEGARLAAAVGLARIGDDGGKQVLADTLANKESPNQLTAASALVELGDYSGFALLEGKLTDSDLGSRQAAAQAVGKIGEKASVPKLIKLLGDDSVIVRIAAAGALVAIVAVDPSVLSQGAIDWTGSALASADFKIRASGASVIGDLPAAQAAPLLALAIADPEAPVRRAAAHSAGKLRGADIATKVMAAVEVEKDAGAKEEMVKALGLIADPAAHDVLARLSADDGRLGMLASGALVAVGDPAGVARLQAGIQSGQREVRLAVVDASVVARNPSVVPVLSAGTNDKDFGVRFASAEALTGYANKDAAVVKTLQDGVENKDVSVQARAVAALAVIGIKTDAGAVDPSAMLDSADPAVRVAAIPVIATLDWATARPLIRRAAVDPDASVRRGVADILSKWAASDHDDVVKQYKVLIEDRDPPVRSISQAQLAKLVKPIGGDPRPAPAAPTPPPAPVVDLVPLQAAVDETNAAAAEVDTASSAVDLKLAALEAGTAKPSTDDKDVAAVELLGAEMTSLAKAVEAATARAHAALDKVHAAAGPTPNDEAQAMVAAAEATVAGVDGTATDVASQAKAGLAKIRAYAKAETGDPDLYLASADAALASGKLGDARRSLDRAAAAYKQARQPNPNLDWSYGQLWDKMAQHEKDPTKHKGYLERAKRSLDTFAHAGSGSRAKQAAARSTEITEELAGGLPE